MSREVTRTGRLAVNPWAILVLVLLVFVTGHIYGTIDYDPWEVLWQPVLGDSDYLSFGEEIHVWVMVLVAVIGFNVAIALVFARLDVRGWRQGLLAAMVLWTGFAFGGTLLHYSRITASFWLVAMDAGNRLVDFAFAGVILGAWLPRARRRETPPPEGLRPPPVTAWLPRLAPALVAALVVQAGLLALVGALTFAPWVGLWGLPAGTAWGDELTGLPLVGQLAGLALTDLALAWLFVRFPVRGAAHGVAVALALWLGFEVTVTVVHYIMIAREPALMALDAGRRVVDFAVAGALLGAWSARRRTG